MTPQDRLTSILWDGAIRSTIPFGATQHAVSMSEASADHIAWLVKEQGFPPWGVMFGRQAVYDAGGGPVWYARPEQFAAVRGTAAAEWAVRYETTPTSRSDWTHEREWRIHGPTVNLRELVPFGVLVGDEAWQPLRWERHMVTADGTPTLDHSAAVDEREGYWVPARPMWPLLKFHISPDTGRLAPAGWTLPAVGQ
ncbi:hypothetical protein [Pseudonocardia sp. NPDC049635]|uniref:hypothetical protein n=1 Tax=Pseudonocardia sp. NPDC049635 TaxID=3155506 RepID=UPI0033C680FA